MIIVDDWSNVFFMIFLILELGLQAHQFSFSSFLFFLISKNQSNAQKFGRLSCGFIYEGEESRVVWFDFPKHNGREILFEGAFLFF